MAKKKKSDSLRVVMLGGIGEIGKNLAVIEYSDEMIVIDCGIGFPDEEMPGIDLVLPDFTYLEKNAAKLRGIFITHGHEDHVGAVPYLLKTVQAPVFGTRLTMGILENKLSEQRLDYKPELVCVEAGDTVQAGSFEVEFIRVNHSIADACCLAVYTPAGTIVHSGDFKLDMTSVDGEMMDLTRLGEIGREGVKLLMCESTNVEHPGYTPSEKTVGQALDTIFKQSQNKRLVVATFSSNVHRVQQIINMSARYGRKVAVTGRSMENVISAAVRLGYMNFPDGLLVDIGEIRNYAPGGLTIITTGSQGEPMSALYRMTYGEHSKVTLGPDDLVVLSAHPIPGNEKLVDRIINELLGRGVQVWRDPTVDVHVSGHACREEIRLMHALIRPEYFMPIHGENKHLYSHRALALEMGMRPDHIFIPAIGKMLQIDAKGASFLTTVPAGQVLIDGNGIGDVGNIVLRDRRLLAEDGLIIVVAAVSEEEMSLLSGPDIVSRGFVYVREADDLMQDLRDTAYESISDCLDRGVTDWMQLKTKVKDELSKEIYHRTRRRPMVLPIILNL